MVLWPADWSSGRQPPLTSRWVAHLFYFLTHSSHVLTHETTKLLAHSVCADVNVGGGLGLCTYWGSRHHCWLFHSMHPSTWSPNFMWSATPRVFWCGSKTILGKSSKVPIDWLYQDHTQKPLDQSAVLMAVDPGSKKEQRGKRCFMLLFRLVIYGACGAAKSWCTSMKASATFTNRT